VHPTRAWATVFEGEAWRKTRGDVSHPSILLNVSHEPFTVHLHAGPTRTASGERLPPGDKYKGPDIVSTLVLQPGHILFHRPLAERRYRLAPASQAGDGPASDYWAVALTRPFYLPREKIVKHWRKIMAKAMKKVAPPPKRTSKKWAVYEKEGRAVAKWAANVASDALVAHRAKVKRSGIILAKMLAEIAAEDSDDGVQQDAARQAKRPRLS
jgi:hypothetical protein